MKKIDIEDRSGNVIGSFRYDPSCPSKYLNRGKLAHDAFDLEAIVKSIDEKDTSLVIGDEEIWDAYRRYDGKMGMIRGY